MPPFWQPTGDYLIRTTPSRRTVALQVEIGPGEGISTPAQQREADRVGFCMWNQVAIEGFYQGHPTGDFDLNREAMETIVRNFRAHPSYEPDPTRRRPIVANEDAGHGQVISFDYGHCSEDAPNPLVGSPAAAWAHDMAMRSGPNGKLELWALVEFLEPAKTYVKEGKYRFTSIAFWPNAKDPHTGDDIGPYVSSIAFTNDPFIQGMAPLAAARKPAELVTQLKKLLQLPETATESEVLEAVKLGRAATDPAPEATGVAPPPEKQTEKQLMAVPLSRIASALGVEVADGDEAAQAVAAERILAAVTRLRTERDESAAAQQRAEAAVASLAEALGVQPSGLNEGVVALQSGRDKALEALNALATALGVEDASAATAKVAELLSASALLQEVMPALSALQGPAKAQEEEEEEHEVMEAMRVHVHPDSHKAMKPAMLNMRRGGVTLPVLDISKGVTQFAADCKALVKALEAKKAAKEQFRKQYPVPQADQQHLLTAYATTPTQPGASPLTYQQPPQPGQPPGPVMPDAPVGHTRIDLSQFPGRNDVERAMACVRKLAKESGEGELDFDTAWGRATAIRRGLPLHA